MDARAFATLKVDGDELEGVQLQQMYELLIEEMVFISVQLSNVMMGILNLEMDEVKHEK